MNIEIINECDQPTYVLSGYAGGILYSSDAIIDFSWMYYNQITISNAAREGARYAVVNCGTKPNWKHETETRMLDDMVGVDSATVVVSDPVGQQITASVTVSPRILTGFTSTILGRNTIELHADCTMRIEH